ncbi:hypothetical protein F5141DRAFT_1066107 [Pisolithus sp. B1]|nr:hypothetical protein F5141DRAFT_1066107 [Pisolithus sp. B1]
MPRIIHLQSFCWFKQFVEGSILMDTVLDNIEFALGSNFDSELHSQPSQGLTVSGNQESSSARLTSTSLASTSSGPLLNDPCVWHLMMDWAKDKIRGIQRKCCKVNASIFIDMDAEEDEEGEEEEEEEEEEEKEEDGQEGGFIHRPQQAEPSGKRSYLQSIDSLCKWFGPNVGDSVVINHPPKRQILATSSRTFALEYIKL